MKVVVIDYGSGNLRSAAKALERAAREAELDAEILVTSQVDDVLSASHVVLPGVGAFGDCRRGLDGLPGMVGALEDVVRGRCRPFLGICVGMQLMAERGLEHGSHAGLGWIPGEVRALEPDDPALRIPHMGWNDLEILAPDHPLLAGIDAGDHVYFVHSYSFACADPADCLARVSYGGPVAAMVGRDNIAGTQFHPEKSQAAGLRLLGNFLRWRP